MLALPLLDRLAHVAAADAVAADPMHPAAPALTLPQLQPLASLLPALPQLDADFERVDSAFSGL